MLARSGASASSRSFLQAGKRSVGVHVFGTLPAMRENVYISVCPLHGHMVNTS